VAGLAVPARLVGHQITVGCFRTSAPKTENGFIAQGNCFVGSSERNIGGKKFNEFSRDALTPDDQAEHRKPAIGAALAPPPMDQDGLFAG
jgi:hypothetical protein